MLVLRELSEDIIHTERFLDSHILTLTNIATLPINVTSGQDGIFLTDSNTAWCVFWVDIQQRERRTIFRSAML